MTTTSYAAPEGFFGKLLQENPLALGLAALALGALLGMLLPETQRENELLGPRRDQLAEQAQNTVKELTQKVTVVAETAKDAARDAVTEAVETVKTEAQHQGLPVGA